MSLGWFIFRVDVLNIRGRAKEWGTPIGSGHFGHVMTGYTYRRRVYAIKRYFMDTPLDLENMGDLDLLENYHETLEMAMKEVCILKLSGVLAIGPYPCFPMGFDLITYSDAIDLCMEKCQPIKFENEEKSKVLLKRLRKLWKRV